MLAKRRISYYIHTHAWRQWSRYTLFPSNICNRLIYYIHCMHLSGRHRNLSSFFYIAEIKLIFELHIYVHSICRKCSEPWFHLLLLSMSVESGASLWGEDIDGGGGTEERVLGWTFGTNRKENQKYSIGTWIFLPIYFEWKKLVIINFNLSWFENTIKSLFCRTQAINEKQFENY